ncbi:MAG TPA: YggS family pyridoxal phosphate-dependent enzyme [Thermoanaerobaculia bacterium]|nr:YggS family pyridoxal phosphate-dependent enzyme [Thermoanaerobaculia bacterium]
MAIDVKANLDVVNRRVAVACQRVGRNPAEIRLIAVTKAFGPEAVEAAIAAGIGDIGENKVQEAREKKASVRSVAQWHFIGHLQSNKVKDAVKLFDTIQTLDSIPLATRVAKAAANEGVRLQVLIQVNLGKEAQKSGVPVAEVQPLVKAIAADMPELKISGLMTLPPHLPPEELRPYFKRLRELRDELRVGVESCHELSMGMSEDFEVAIEEGATMIRLGRALFGARK